jgi:hypothetical protein
MNVAATIDNPELVIGLVGPIGVDLDAIINLLQKSLRAVAYETKVIHITAVMRDLLPNLTFEDETYSARYRSLIANADWVRRTADNQAALSCIAISEIRRLRQEAAGQLIQRSRVKRHLTRPPTSFDNLSEKKKSLSYDKFTVESLFKFQCSRTLTNVGNVWSRR